MRILLRGICLLAVLCIIFICASCNHKNNSVTIQILKTVDSYELYQVIHICDSLTLVRSRNSIVDTNALPMDKQMELKENSSKSVYSKDKGFPILELLSDMYDYNPGTKSFVFNNSAILGTAECRDTAKINTWLLNKQCTSKEIYFFYKWMVSSDNPEKCFLIGLKEAKPIFNLHYKDVDSIKLTPADLSRLVNKFAPDGDKILPSKYSLDIVFKPTVWKSIQIAIQTDLKSGYLAVVTSGEFKYIVPIGRRDILKEQLLRGVTIIDKEKMKHFMDGFEAEVVTVGF